MELDDDTEYEYGLREIKAPKVTLRVTATDTGELSDTATTSLTSAEEKD